jgi:hypothetical protein
VQSFRDLRSPATIRWAALPRTPARKPPSSVIARRAKPDVAIFSCPVFTRHHSLRRFPPRASDALTVFPRQ